MPNYLDGLNEKQKEAVLHKDGPLLILAGAGAGKTKTITHRILHLIKTGVPPREILAITFTNKAAKEMSDRIKKLLFSESTIHNLGLGAGTPFMSTFHSLGVRILKENAERLGIPRHFGIFDRGDSLRAVKEAMKGVGVDPKNFEPGRILSFISREKGNMVTAEKFAEKVINDYVPKMVALIWKKYEEILKSEKALDFDDLLLRTALLLKENEQVRTHYQNTWKYIHIDEYQDTNKVQYMVAKLLAQKNRNICVVGDGDQSIYGWRGADMKNILDFEKDYPEAKVVLLEENYRSTQNILTAANRIIAKNKIRKEKNLFTKKEMGEKIGVFTAYDEADEARFVATKSKELMKNGVSPKEIAVLYRANFQSRVLESEFLAEEIPYQVLGTRFFERKEVKDVVSYIRLAFNPASLSDMKRVINVPARGIGKVTLLKIFAGQESVLPMAMKEKLAKFRNLLGEIKEKADSEKLSETIKFIIRQTGMEGDLKSGKEEDLERLENIRELATFALKYDILEPKEAVEKFLTDVALASDQDELMKERDAVRLMTVHAAKGLEFDYVFITGLEEDLFPHRKIGEKEVSEGESEEERRLFYVAVTRARKKIYLSHAGVRTIFGSRAVQLPSEFLFDIPEDLAEREEPLQGGGKIIFFD